jgi:hypothetical protein
MSRVSVKIFGVHGYCMPDPIEAPLPQPGALLALRAQQLARRYASHTANFISQSRRSRCALESDEHRQLHHPKNRWECNHGVTFMVAAADLPARKRFLATCDANHSWREIPIERLQMHRDLFVAL